MEVVIPAFSRGTAIEKHIRDQLMHQMAHVVALPAWVLSLAEDHVKSLKMCFSQFADKRQKIDAILLQNCSGIVPDFSISRNSISVEAVQPKRSMLVVSAIDQIMREYDVLKESLQTAEQDMLRSMASTLEMMNCVAVRNGRLAFTQQELTSWLQWFGAKISKTIELEEQRLTSKKLDLKGKTSRRGRSRSCVVD